MADEGGLISGERVELGMTYVRSWVGINEGGNFRP